MSFSPLFIAAWSATSGWDTRRNDTELSVRFSSRHGVQPSSRYPLRSRRYTFSPLFIAAWSATSGLPRWSDSIMCSFQSAFHRGMECNHPVAPKPSSQSFLSVRFSSRHGVQLVLAFARTRSRMVSFQSAFHRGMECNTPRSTKTIITIISFSPLFIAAWSTTGNGNGSGKKAEKLSVRFSSRHGVQL